MAAITKAKKKNSTANKISPGSTLLTRSITGVTSDAAPSSQPQIELCTTNHTVAAEIALKYVKKVSAHCFSLNDRLYSIRLTLEEGAFDVCRYLNPRDCLCELVHLCEPRPTEDRRSTSAGLPKNQISERR